MYRIGAEQRRARLARRHHLAADSRAASAAQAAEGVVALHATDPATVFRSVWARTEGVRPEDVEHALYEERSLVRLKAMRGTLFVAPTRLRPALVGAYGEAAARRERSRLLKIIAELELSDDDGAWLAAVERDTLDAVRARGEALGRELSTDVPELQTKFTYGEGRRWAAESSLTTWVLNLLSAEGRIVRVRPAGSWSSGQYRWAPADWLGDRAGERPDEEKARAEVVGTWLRSFGPGTVNDLKWWTGFTVAQVRRALAAVDVVEVDMDGVTGVVLPDDLEPVPATDPTGPADPWVAVLPPLDPTAMGWKDRDWYLSEQARARLFDRSGNIGPSIWCDGRVVGGWAQPTNGDGAGSIVYELFEDIGEDRSELLRAEVGRLEEWHGDVPVARRGRTACPVEQDLISL